MRDDDAIQNGQNYHLAIVGGDDCYAETVADVAALLDASGRKAFTLRRLDCWGPQGVVKVQLSPKRNAWGEYVARAYGADGGRRRMADYFTNHWDDAVATTLAMMRR